jgi:hypothetical protein
MQHDMRHLDFIRAVALEDVRYVDKKDRSYGGSWKRRGGVGAFMMLARKWDRLENEMQKVGVNYDIFKCIELEERVQGEDGTALAEIRDLRRYCMLVEAEMMARGVVKIPDVITQALHGHGNVTAASAGELARAANPENNPAWRLEHVEDYVPDRSIRELDPSFGAVVADGMIHEPGRVPRIARRCEKCGEVIEREEDTYVWTNLSDGTDRYYHLSHKPGLQPAVPRRVMDTPSCGDGSFDARMQRTPEDGAQHENCGPWIVGSGYFLRKEINVQMRELFWHVRAPGVHVLEPHVRSEQIPRVLQMFYLLDINDNHSWTLRIDKCPPDARSMFPSLAREKNMKELEELPPWQQRLYVWNGSANKYELTERTAAWHVEAE